MKKLAIAAIAIMMMGTAVFASSLPETSEKEVETVTANTTYEVKGIVVEKENGEYSIQTENGNEYTMTAETGAYSTGTNITVVMNDNGTPSYEDDTIAYIK